MRSISQFNAPGMIAKPHFLPTVEPSRCVACGKCISVCPMGALSLEAGKLSFDNARCIGCGLCVLSCPAKALSLAEAPGAAPQQSSRSSLFFDLVPGYLTNAFRVWLRRNLKRAGHD